MLFCLAALTLSTTLPAAEPVELHYKFDLEEPVRYEMIQDIKQTQSMFGQSVESSTKVRQGLSTELVRTLDDGSIIIANTLETMSLAIDAPGYSLAFDSEREADQKKLSDPTIGSMAAMLGVQVHLHMTPEGDVVDVPNLDRVQSIVDDMKDPQVIAGVQPLLERETIISMNEMNYKLLPAEPVSVGDQWDRSFEIPFGTSSMTTSFTLTLKSVEDGIASVDILGLISMPPQVESGVTTTIQRAEVTGLLEFNIEDGLSEYYTMTNQMTIDARTTGAESPDVIVQMVQEVSMTRIDD